MSLLGCPSFHRGPGLVSRTGPGCHVERVARPPSSAPGSPRPAQSRRGGAGAGFDRHEGVDWRERTARPPCWFRLRGRRVLTRGRHARLDTAPHSLSEDGWPAAHAVMPGLRTPTGGPPRWPNSGRMRRCPSLRSGTTIGVTSRAGANAGRTSTRSATRRHPATQRPSSIQTGHSYRRGTCIPPRATRSTPRTGGTTTSGRRSTSTRPGTLPCGLAPTRLSWSAAGAARTISSSW
jgi:hypothetical protein